MVGTKLGNLHLLSNFIPITWKVEILIFIVDGGPNTEKAKSVSLKSQHLQTAVLGNIFQLKITWGTFSMISMIIQVDFWFWGIMQILAKE